MLHFLLPNDAGLPCAEADNELHLFDAEFDSRRGLQFREVDETLLFELDDDAHKGATELEERVVLRSRRSTEFKGFIIVLSPQSFQSASTAAMQVYVPPNV